MTTKPPKPRKCKTCATEFVPTKPMQKVCSPGCAYELVKQAASRKAAKQARIERKATRAKLDALRTRPQLVAAAQKAFNAFVRARDVGKRCISCDTQLTDAPNTFDAGHYRSVGSAPHMRFVEDNCHGQCKHCNNFLGGNVLTYRRGLIERIGLARVEQIECDQVPRKYTKEALIELARHYREQARNLAKGRP